MAGELLLLNGPNLHALGTREPALYGVETLEQIVGRVRRRAAALGWTVRALQSAHEGVLVDAVHEATAHGVRGAVINAAAYTHTSVALRDALLATQLPFVEVHLSNVYAREPFRHRSLLADIAVGSVIGLGPIGYELAVEGLLDHLVRRPAS